MDLPNSRIKLLLGAPIENICKSLPFKIYDVLVIDFLSEVSREIISQSKENESLRIFSYFALWSRKNNLLRLKKNRIDIHKRYGRGISLHIAPSNVVTNILFTISFGLLSGCPSVIRVSEKNIDEFKKVLLIISKILLKNKFKFIENYLSIISYEHDDNISKYLSLICDIRVIWGGDSTISYFKKFETNPKNLDIVFPNRTSIAIISGEWLRNSNQKDKHIIAKSFANDISLFSQRACSSPKKLIVLDNKDDNFDINNLVNDFLLNCDSAIDSVKNKENFHRLNNFKSASYLSTLLIDSYESFKGRNIFAIYDTDHQVLNADEAFENCCLVINKIKNISEIKNLIDKENQTIVQIGLNETDLNELINISAPMGTDRIVKAGMALNMDIFWDGYDTVSLMSRFIEY